MSEGKKEKHRNRKLLEELGLSSGDRGKTWYARETPQNTSAPEPSAPFCSLCEMNHFGDVCPMWSR